MRGIATFQMHGRVATNPEFSTLQNGQVRCSFTVVANVPKKAPNGKWEEDPVWVRIAFFGDQARRVRDKVWKGAVVVVHGDFSSYERQVGGEVARSYSFRPRVFSVCGDRPVARSRTSAEVPVDDDSQVSAEEGPPDSGHQPVSDKASGEVLPVDPSSDEEIEKLF